MNYKNELKLEWNEHLMLLFPQGPNFFLVTKFSLATTFCLHKILSTSKEQHKYDMQDRCDIRLTCVLFVRQYRSHKAFMSYFYWI